MGRIFKRVRYSDYLGEVRPILDTYVSFFGTPTPSPTPSVTPTSTPTPTPTPTPSSTPQPSIITAGLLTYFDGTDGSSLSGSGATRWYSIDGSLTRDFTLYNSPTYTTDYGGGLIFDGVDDWAMADIIQPTGANDPFTYEMWFEWIFTSAFKRVYATNGSQYDMAHGGNRTIAWYSPANSWNTPSVTTGADGYYYDNTPYHFVASYDGSTLKFYSNSVLYYSATSVSIDVDTTKSALSANCCAGGDYNTNTFFKIRTYDTAFTDADVLNNFNVEKANYGY